MKKTEVFDFKNIIDDEKLNICAEIIKNGGLVAIPTETVYGLACDGLNSDAIKKIFDAKKRPMDNPLILHISNIDELNSLAKNIRKKDFDILKKIWPGPLTVVLNKSEIIPDEISAGLDSVAIRMPDKDIARRLIKITGRPLAAPSANLSTKPSPTNISSVLDDMDGRIDAVIDGGDCSIGIESTVLDLTSSIPKILRPGYFTKEMLEEYWEKVDYDMALKNDKEVPKSPGQKYKHYAPNTKVLVLIGSDEDVVNEILNILKSNSNIGVMVFEDDIKYIDIPNLINMGSKTELDRMGSILFDSLRELDKRKLDLIVVRGVEEEGYGLSIMNRLKKSSSNNIRRL